MITVVLFPNEYLKHCGIVRCKSSWLGHLINGDNLTSSTTIQDLKILDTVGRDILKRYAISPSGKLSFNFISVKMYS